MNELNLTMECVSDDSLLAIAQIKVIQSNNARKIPLLNQIVDACISEEIDFQLRILKIIHE